MKIFVIIPYFGKFNNYFQLWLASCGKNPNYDWLLFTDNRKPDILPENVHYIFTSFDDLKRKFESKFRYKICLDKPYKLCDYKPYYGYLFEEYLTDCDFWGYCDCDLIFGNLSKVITPDVLQFDKIFRTGHFSLIRNNKNINNVFLKYDTYKIVTTSPAIYGYDESVNGYHKGFAGELIENGYSLLDSSEGIADIDFRHFPFYVVSDQTKVPCIFIYHDGTLLQTIKKGAEITKREVMYVHLQKRKMINNVCSESEYMIYPNKFTSYDPDKLNDQNFWNEISSELEGYFEPRKEIHYERKRNLIRLLHEPDKIGSILYRIKGHQNS